MEVEKNVQQGKDYKEEGNKHFKKGELVKAIEQYSLAIEAHDQEASYFGNRAACYLSLKKYNKCIQDCNLTLALDPKFVKALKRRGKAHFFLGKWAASLSDFKEAVSIDSKDKESQKEVDTL